MADYDVMGSHYSVLRPKGSDEIVLSMPLGSVLIAYEWRRMATRCRCVERLTVVHGVHELCKNGKESGDALQRVAVPS